MTNNIALPKDTTLWNTWKYSHLPKSKEQSSILENWCFIRVIGFPLTVLLEYLDFSSFLIFVIIGQD